MAECRRYCSLIIKARTDAGFSSLKYPVISASLNRYFLPEYRQLIADECNLIGYMSEFPPVVYDQQQTKPVIIDTTRTLWQQQMADERELKRNKAIKRKENEKVL